MQTKDKAKFSGLERKLKTWLIIAKMVLMKYVLHELSRFSLYLQCRDAIIMTVGDHLKVELSTLEAMKDARGSTLQNVMNILPDIQDDDNVAGGD